MRLDYIFSIVLLFVSVLLAFALFTFSNDVVDICYIPSTPLSHIRYQYNPFYPGPYDSMNTTGT